MQTSGLQVICAAAGACSGNGTDTCARSIGRREKASGECAEGLRDRRGARKSSEGTPRGARVRRARGEERRGVGARLMLPVLSIANVAGSKQRRQRGMRGMVVAGRWGERWRGGEGGRERGKNSSPFCV